MERFFVGIQTVAAWLSSARFSRRCPFVTDLQVHTLISMVEEEKEIIVGRKQIFRNCECRTRSNWGNQL